MKLQSDRFNFGDMYPQYWTPSIGGTYHWSELVIFLAEIPKTHQNRTNRVSWTSAIM